MSNHQEEGTEKRPSLTSFWFASWFIGDFQVVVVGIFSPLDNDGKQEQFAKKIIERELGNSVNVVCSRDGGARCRSHAGSAAGIGLGFAFASQPFTASEGARSEKRPPPAAGAARINRRQQAGEA